MPYFCFTLVKLPYPGIHYDEVFFGNAAWGGIDEYSFVAYKIGRFPVLLMPYVGALKAYLFYPIFNLFGASPYSIRLPGILITFSSLLLLHRALTRYFDRSIALSVLFLIGIDSSFISQTRVDFGPVVIDFACKAATFHLFARFLERRSLAGLGWIHLVWWIGLFNKLNFLWFINGFLLAALIAYRADWRRMVRERSAKEKIALLSINVFGYSLALLYYVFIRITYHWYPLFSGRILLGVDPHKLGITYELFRSLVTGEGFYRLALGDIHPSVSNYYFAFILLVLILGGISIITRRIRFDRHARRSHLFFLLIAVLTVFQIYVTEEATAIWHIFAVYPAYSVLLGHSLDAIVRWIAPARRGRAIAVMLLIAGIGAYQASMNFRYIRAYDQPTRDINWSKAIYDLVDFTKASPRNFVSVDWGIHNQLITLTGAKNRYFDLHLTLNKELSERDRGILIRDILEPRNHIALIFHPEDASVFPLPRRTLMSWASLGLLDLRLMRTIADDNGRIVFEIYVPQKTR